MTDYEVLATDFNEIDLNRYRPDIWSPEDVVERNKESYEVEEPPSDEVVHDILSEVEEAQEKAEKSGAEFYNGPLVRLEDFNVQDGTLNIELQNTNYFSHVGTRDRPELDKENRADPLSVGAHLLTSDGYILLGEKSDLNEIGSGEYQLPGAGYIEDPETQYEESLNAQPSSPIHRELNEEVNLGLRQLTHPEPSALIGAVHRQPMLVYDTETVLSSDEVIDEWLDILEDKREFSGLAFIPAEDVPEVLEGEIDALFTDPEDPDEIVERRYTDDLRPHAEGALEAFNNL